MATKRFVKRGKNMEIATGRFDISRFPLDSTRQSDLETENINDKKLLKADLQVACEALRLEIKQQDLIIEELSKHLAVADLEDIVL